MSPCNNNFRYRVRKKTHDPLRNKTSKHVQVTLQFPRSFVAFKLPTSTSKAVILTVVASILRRHFALHLNDSRSASEIQTIAGKVLDTLIDNLNDRAKKSRQATNWSSSRLLLSVEVHEFLDPGENNTEMSTVSREGSPQRARPFSLKLYRSRLSQDF